MPAGREGAPTRFAFEALPGRVVFGRGTSVSRLGPELEAHGARQLLAIFAEPERAIAERLIAPLGDLVAGTFTAVRPHVPAEVATAARERAEECGARWLLSIGGGSTTGTAKAIALESELPIAAVPTTYAGSEVTPVWGVTTDRRKQTGRSLDVLPALVVYDPDLTASLPASIAVPSAFNAFAHCAEAFYAPGANPITSLVAEEGLRALSAGLRLTVARGGEGGEELLLYGAYLGGSAFAVAGSGIHHKICHVLGGGLDLPHAETHTALLPQVLAFNEEAMPEAAARIQAAIATPLEESAEGAAAATFDAIAAAGGPLSLAELGMPRAAVAGMVDAALAAVPASNPRPVGAEDVFQILEAAFEGRRPTVVESGRMR